MRHLKVVTADDKPDVGGTLGVTQARMLEVAERNGVTLDGALTRLGRIIDGDDDAGAILAIRTLFDYTTGRAPTNARTLNMHVSGKSDAFFEKAVFEKPPAPRLDD